MTSIIPDCNHFIQSHSERDITPRVDSHLQLGCHHHHPNKFAQPVRLNIDRPFPSLLSSRPSPFPVAAPNSDVRPELAVVLEFGL